MGAASKSAIPLPLMPKATAVWLVDNTSLTFDQIAIFCGMHPLEVKGIANDDVAHGIKGIDPITAGQLTREELERCQADPAAHLELAEKSTEVPQPTKHKGGKYTPLSKRQERPDAIAWLVRSHPELNDAEIGRLVVTTKPTIVSVRERTHWNMSQISPVDPVTLGLCTQIDLDAAVAKAARREANRAKRQIREERKLLREAEETTAITGDSETSEAPAAAEESSNPFAALGSLNKNNESENNEGETPDNSDTLNPEDVFKN